MFRVGQVFQSHHASEHNHSLKRPSQRPPPTSSLPVVCKHQQTQHFHGFLTIEYMYILSKIIRFLPTQVRTIRDSRFDPIVSIKRPSTQHVAFLRSRSSRCWIIRAGMVCRYRYSHRDAQLLRELSKKFCSGSTILSSVQYITLYKTVKNC